MLKRFKTNRVFEIDYDAPIVVLDKQVIGGRLRACRKARGVTQEELANAIYTDRSNMHRIESGKALASLYTLIRICNALEIPVDMILKGYTHSASTTVGDKEKG